MGNVSTFSPSPKYYNLHHLDLSRASTIRTGNPDQIPSAASESSADCCGTIYRAAAWQIGRLGPSCCHIIRSRHSTAPLLSCAELPAIRAIDSSVLR